MNGRDFQSAGGGGNDVAHRDSIPALGALAGQPLAQVGTGGADAERVWGADVF